MLHIKTPNLPQNKVELMLVDERISENIYNSLNNLGIKIIKVKKCPLLQEGVSAHPDMLMFYGGDGDIVIAPDVFSDYVILLNDKGFNPIKGKTYLKTNYPYDIAYNAAVAGKYIICNEKHTDKEILSLCYNKGIEIINTNQGYAKCSVCVVSENAIITSDRGIYKSVKDYGIDTLLIREGYIELNGYSHGFIGGASGKINPETLCFTGNIEKHPDYEKIIEFCSRHNCKVLSLYNDNLYDYGSLIPLCEV